jgi:protein transport protein SEC31
MATRATDPYECQVWSFMQIMFETNAREELLSYLGFDPETINQAAMEFNEEEEGKRNGSSNALHSPGSDGNGSKVARMAMSKSAENTVKDALLVGNFEAAVECCFRSGNLADALILASCGGADLWQKTQAEYFARESKSRPFLSLISAVINDQLNELVAASDPSKWRETLAVLSTYGKSDEFPALCAALGDRLEEAGGDFANASLCYMCALKLGDAVRYWKYTLQNTNMAYEGGTSDLLSLHDFIEKVTVFSQALDSSQYQLDDDVAKLFTDYSKALANQGMLVSAAKYLKGFDTQECKELRDRIYCSRMGRFCPDLMASPPDFPFDYVNVGVAQDLHGINVRQGGVQQHMQMHQQHDFAAQLTDPIFAQQTQEEQQSQQLQQSPQFQPSPSEVRLSLF